MILNKNDKPVKDVKRIINKSDKTFANITRKLNLKEGTGTSFESQESCRMRKVKNGNKDLLKTQFQVHLKIYLYAKQVSQMMFQFLLRKRLLMLSAQKL